MATAKPVYAQMQRHSKACVYADAGLVLRKFGAYSGKKPAQANCYCICLSWQTCTQIDAIKITEELSFMC